MQPYNSFPGMANNGSALNGEPIMSNSSPRAQAVPRSKPFVPSYRLFEDLNVLGSGDSRFKASGSSSTNPSMAGGRK